MNKKLERSQILLESSQRAALEELAKRRGSSLSGVIRMILDEYFAIQEKERQQRVARWQKEKLFIEALDQRGPVAGGRTWKREDLYDE